MVRGARGLRAGADTPLGPIWVEETSGALTAAGWGPASPPPLGSLAAEALAQFGAYLSGSLRHFDLPLAPATGLAARTRAALLAIPFGETRIYGALAAALSISPQAAGQACGANPLPIFVPCHRVLSATSLGGYSGAGGIETKISLLRLEGAASLLL
ncbi:methylated-DNA--[protein]-cysteine S-methyltransferase [Pseudoroseicyclus tamaricis]|uniref:Methylated-DNA--[protein]-cysteine S-methyltransferase n=1 Tax=Pseudoroseicyclus tamaricis TaxID=2705421 RepID=A0A6B2JK79_9RHOB|nr:methylated-DNA--[protein]-cysteine S-methyltransferase [Pseudoroseicyclus tamaricis]NDV01863.1 methylated-DNA--[protein]-cysteine S-methyltransferase [Pseudoroseicyclus tamaricis]